MESVDFKEVDVGVMPKERLSHTKGNCTSHQKVIHAPVAQGIEHSPPNGTRECAEAYSLVRTLCPIELGVKNA